MNEIEFEDFFESVLEEIEENASYWRADENDKAKYWTGSEILVPMTWTLLNIGLPILTGVATNFISERLKKKKIEEKKQESSTFIIENINIYNEQNLTVKEPNEEKAVSEIESYLAKHGWPKDEANKNAKNILSIMKDNLIRNE